MSTAKGQRQWNGEKTVLRSGAKTSGCLHATSKINKQKILYTQALDFSQKLPQNGV